MPNNTTGADKYRQTTTQYSQPTTDPQTSREDLTFCEDVAAGIEGATHEHVAAVVAALERCERTYPRASDLDVALPATQVGRVLAALAAREDGPDVERWRESERVRWRVGGGER